MTSQIITSKLFIDSLINGFKIVFPFFMPFIIGAIAIMVIKKIVTSTVLNFSLIAGDSRRTAKKKAKIAGDIVDLTSSINDIKGAIK